MVRPLLLSLSLVLGCAEVGRPFPDAAAPEVTGGVIAGDVGEAPDPGTFEDAPAAPDGGASDDAEAPDAAPPGDPGPARVDALEPDVEEGSDVDEGDAADGAEGDTEDDGTDAGPTDPRCVPCLGDPDCGDLACVSYGPSGWFCSPGCEAFVCGPADDGRTTTCQVSSAFGTCVGHRACTDGALSDCDAPVPSHDACDGLDNDCDGVTDAGWPDTDADGVADCVDPDDDGDGTPDQGDNCPKVANPDQADLDGDMLGDACDPDIDGDGVPNEDDCAPLDPEATGGSTEVCNGKDDDCDGETDEPGAAGCSEWYADADNDGYGAPGALCLCAPDAVYKVKVAGDCADGDPFRHPGAGEACNGVDDDCDGTTDEPDAAGCKPFYWDEDGDGFYLAGAFVACLCQPEPSVKFTGVTVGDCDDTKATIYPGAPEICDHADQSCDGAVDEGCDDDGDGWCDADMAYGGQWGLTCPHGPGDCDDDAPDVNPGATEVCDGIDNNCNPADDLDTGGGTACGPSCTPCPTPPAGGDYQCVGTGDAAECVLVCANGGFCADCNCDGDTVFALGAEVQDAKVLYDVAYDTFRVAYVKNGAFRLRAVTAKGGLGNDVVAVAGVTKWTDWGVAQNTATGEFFFAWTAYPDSAVRVGVAGPTGTAIAQAVVVEDLAGAALREYVRMAWHASSKTFLLLWDETGSLGLDVRGALLGGNGALLGAAFPVAGGAGDQQYPQVRTRGEPGHAVAFVTPEGPLRRIVVNTVDGSASVLTEYVLEVDVQPQSAPDVWWSTALDRGVVQWLGSDSQYRLRVVGPAGALGQPVQNLGGKAGVALGSKLQGAFRVAYFADGMVRIRTVDAATGAVGASDTIVSDAELVTGMVGGELHPDGHGIVLWNAGGLMRGRLIAP